MVISNKVSVSGTSSIGIVASSYAKGDPSAVTYVRNNGALSSTKADGIDASSKSTSLGVANGSASTIVRNSGSGSITAGLIGISNGLP